jgi:hypothetical protein
MVVALEIGGHQHAAGTTGVIGDQLIRRQIGQCLIQNPAILFPADDQMIDSSPELEMCRQQHRCPVNVPVHFIPVFQIKAGPQVGCRFSPG